MISCMGAGNKLDPTQFHVADIYKTTMCPLAKVMRHELKKRGVKKLKVVYSTEKPVRPLEDMSVSCRSHCVCLQEQRISVPREETFQEVLHLCRQWQD